MIDVFCCCDDDVDVYCDDDDVDDVCIVVVMCDGVLWVVMLL